MDRFDPAFLHPRKVSGDKPDLGHAQGESTFYSLHHLLQVTFETGWSSWWAHRAKLSQTCGSQLHARWRVWPDTMQRT